MPSSSVQYSKYFIQCLTDRPNECTVLCMQFFYVCSKCRGVSVALVGCRKVCWGLREAGHRRVHSLYLRAQNVLLWRGIKKAVVWSYKGKLNFPWLGILWNSEPRPSFKDSDSAARWVRNTPIMSDLKQVIIRPFFFLLFFFLHGDMFKKRRKGEGDFVLSL